MTTRRDPTSRKLRLVTSTAVHAHISSLSDPDPGSVFPIGSVGQLDGADERRAHSVATRPALRAQLCCGPLRSCLFSRARRCSSRLPSAICAACCALVTSPSHAMRSSIAFVPLALAALAEIAAAQSAQPPRLARRQNQVTTCSFTQTATGTIAATSSTASCAPSSVCGAPTATSSTTVGGDAQTTTVEQVRQRCVYGPV